MCQSNFSKLFSNWLIKLLKLAVWAVSIFQTRSVRSCSFFLFLFSPSQCEIMQMTDCRPTHLFYCFHTQHFHRTIKNRFWIDFDINAKKKGAAILLSFIMSMKYNSTQRWHRRTVSAWEPLGLQVRGLSSTALTSSASLFSIQFIIILTFFIILYCFLNSYK